MLTIIEDTVAMERADPKADADREGYHSVDRTGTQAIPDFGRID